MILKATVKVFALILVEVDGVGRRAFMNGNLKIDAEGHFYGFTTRLTATRLLLISEY